MSKCTDNSINISSSTNIVDDVTNDIEKLTTATDVDAPTRSEMTSSEKKCTSCDQNLEHTKTNEIGAELEHTTMNDIVSNVEKLQTCANCGKEGASNTCNKCNMVKYCNAVCKKRHRHKHKKECEEHLRGAAELREEELKHAAKLRDMKLFKQPPQKDDDCPICFQRLPYLETGKRYKACCGKVICSGCIHAVQLVDGGLCPFCRIPMADLDDKDLINGVQKRVDAGDAQAMRNFGIFYSHGSHGLSRDYAKALELWKLGAELGHDEAYHSIGVAYMFGEGVKMDGKKALHYWEEAAMRGNIESRYNLGLFEDEAGNKERAVKHYMITIRGGHDKSLNEIKELYSNGHATKNDYTEALRSYQQYISEVKSPQRDEAAAFDDEYKYIE